MGINRWTIILIQSFQCIQCYNYNPKKHEQQGAAICCKYICTVHCALHRLKRKRVFVQAVLRSWPSKPQCVNVCEDDGLFSLLQLELYLCCNNLQWYYDVTERERMIMDRSLFLHSSSQQVCLRKKKKRTKNRENKFKILVYL